MCANVLCTTNAPSNIAQAQGRKVTLLLLFFADNYEMATNDLLGVVCQNRQLVRLSCTGCVHLTDSGIAALAGMCLRS